MGNGIILIIMGFIFGLGSVTVIDIHGFLAQRSHYWTQATTRSHKITKPLIWSGIFMVLVGHMILFVNGSMSEQEFLSRFAIIAIMIINGIYLSFFISPYLIKREQQHKDSQFLSPGMRIGIFASFFTSLICWWGLLVIFFDYLGLF